MIAGDGMEGNGPRPCQPMSGDGSSLNKRPNCRVPPTLGRGAEPVAAVGPNVWDDMMIDCREA